MKKSMLSFILHPISTFVLGVIFAVLFLFFYLKAQPLADSQKLTADYQKALAEASQPGPPVDSPEEKAALDRFSLFLANVGNADFLKENTSKTYAPGAYLDDTLVTHHGPEEIRDYFLATAGTMTHYSFEKLGHARSGEDHYFRWKMIFSAPKLANGQEVHSVGVSQVRFNAEGQVTFHQDFWDSGKHIYGQIPVVGGLLESIRKRF